MKCTAIIVALFLFVFEPVCFAQDNSWLNTASKSEKVERARKLLLDAVINADSAETIKIFGFLLDMENKHYITVYPAEKILLSYLTHDFMPVLEEVELEEYWDQHHAYFGMVHPESDYLYVKLKEKVAENKGSINSAVRKSRFAAIDKAFLLLNLDYHLLYVVPGITQETVNASANQFLETYPQSEYEMYIREHIRHMRRPGNWAFAFEFFSGYGRFTDDLTNSFTNNIPFGVAFDIFYKRYAFFLRNYIGFGKTTRAIEFNGGTWRDDAQTRIYLPELSVGYLIGRFDKLRIVPFAGISSTSVSPTEHDLDKYEEYDNVGLDFTTTTSVGINLDIVMGGSSTPGIMASEQENWFLRLRYSYNQPQFSKKYDGFDGKFHYFTVGIGGFGQSTTRDY